MQKAILATFLAILMTTNAVAAEGVTPVSKKSGSTYFGDYEPSEPKSLDDVSSPAKERLIAHLKERLGDAFYTRLRFSGGQVIDFAKLARMEPDSKDYQWEVPAYILDFEFVMPEVGISSYVAQIELRNDGSIIKEIDLPNFTRNPMKLHFFPLSDAIQVAINSGFLPSQMSTAIDYSESDDSIVWEFAQIVEDDGLVIRSKKIQVSAHTGLIIHSGSTEAIR